MQVKVNEGQRRYTHPIPDDALDDRHAFVGTSGSGKTYGAGTAVERVLTRTGRVIIVDPLGVWWGLRLRADGATASKFNVVIFGGAHADLPITEHVGALIGETVAGMAESCIVDLSSMPSKAAERRFMLAFLEAIYRKASGEPVHLIFDEADLWAPQKSLEPQLQAKMEQIVRRGRVKGFIPWLITQRPAVLSKDVLSQADGLVAFKLTSSHDRDAVKAWIEGQADKAREKEILVQLATMTKGEAVVWIPSRNVLVTAEFPEKVTFDSSRTPKRGETVRHTALAPIDLGVLKSKLASVEAEVKENDPKMLRAEITRLKSDIGQLIKSPKPDMPDPVAIEAAEKRGYAEGYKAGKHDGGRSVAHNQMVRVIDSLVGATMINGDADILHNAVERMREEVTIDVSPPPVSPTRAGSTIAGARPVPKASHTPPPASGGGTLNSAGQKMLAILDTNPPVKRSWAQVATLAGLKARGGHFNEGRKGLLLSGLIQVDGNSIWIAQPSNQAGHGRHDPAELAEIWAGNLSGAAPKILRHLAATWPATRQEIADALGMQPRGGHWNDAWKQLRDNDIVRMDGERAELNELFRKAK